MPARFRPRQRLRTRAEFDQVFRRGVRLDGRLFSLVAAANGRDEDRLGLATSRRVGSAVRRNRARRLLRESFRRLERGARAAVDLVVLVKPELASSGLAEVQSELQQRLERLRHAPGARRARPAAPR
jgi:ribonuclease P protein component